MGILYGNVINEVQKLFLKKKTVVFLIITALIPIATAVAASIFQNNLGIIPVNASDFPTLVLGILTNFFLPLFIFTSSIDLFAGELSERTLKIVLLRPITRLKVFISKIIAGEIYVIVNLGIVFIFSAISSFFLSGKEQILQGLISGAFAYILAALPMLALVIVAAFIAQLFKSSSGALAISIFVYVALKAVSVLFPSLSKVLVTSYTDWHLLLIGSFISIRQVISAFMVILSYGIIFFALGYYLFDKREL